MNARCALALALLLALNTAPLAVASESIAVDFIHTALQKLADYQTSGGQHKGWRLSFEVPESFVNFYIRHLIAGHQRQGVTEAQVRFLGNNEATITCTLDLRKVREWHPPSIPAESPLAGKDLLKVNARASVAAADGTVTFTLLSATDPDNVADSKLLVAMINLVALHQPEYYQFDKPLPLPFGLKSVSLQKGYLVVDAR